MGKIKALAKRERPREKLQDKGAQALSDLELMAILLGSGTPRQEHFLCISLNGGHEVIAVRTVSVGLVNKTQVHPREVFADPITDRASAIIVAHNHPAGSLEPSREDITVTQQLKSAGQTLGIQLLDHIIFNHRGYYSFLENGAFNNADNV